MTEKMFKDLQIGTVFFDPYCGDEFMKISTNEAKDIINDVVDEFGLNEIVELTGPVSR